MHVYSVSRVYIHNFQGGGGGGGGGGGALSAFVTSVCEVHEKILILLILCPEP